ncbi:amino acid transporter [Trichodelitschia bisporula]|uniref:Amino acid transporter n=1 Tax=Trichodelitschia bisporula TaxID=703511 RepID=A0A6G1HWM8_9PEZI|nr:amino acid transporter [Trichodelitschia bisporula]
MDRGGDMVEKHDYDVHSGTIEPGASDDNLSDRHRGTYHDVQDMGRLGKKQEFMRNFRFYSILGFTSTLMCTWEAILASSAYGLIDGGTGGLIWTYLATIIMMTLVIASMADMASMAPTSGGQYHWVSEFAPKSCQRYLSYVVGWAGVLGWQAGTASACFLAGTMIQALIVLWDETYTPTRWQGTLLTIAIALIATFFNTYGAKQLPLLEGFILLLHVFGFFGILIPLWVVAPKQEASKVFGSFSDGGGWGSIGTACLVGMISPIFSFIGPDAGTHMSEEIRDASKIVPRSMIATAALNGTLGFVMVITYSFTILDVDEALSSPTGLLGFPFIHIFWKATGSKGGTTAMVVIIVALLTSAAISILATASRQSFAFARDDGLPFPHVWRKVVRVGTELPLNSVLLSLTVTIGLSLVNIGSTAAFNSIISLLVSSLFTGYFVSIGAILLKRIRGEPLPPSRWSMGRLAIPINILALLFIVLSLVISFFPLARGPTAQSMNWSLLVWGVIMIAATISYFVSGRHVYKGPVVYVNKDFETASRRS